MPCAIALGELLIDFTPHGISENGNALFERNPGGAPANLAVQLVRLGVPCAFLGKVGTDMFGYFLKDTLQKNGVKTDGLKFSEEATSLAFVQLDQRGDRNFSFYRRPGADTQLRDEDIDYREIDRCDLLDFGSLLFTDEPSRTTVHHVLQYAKERKKLIAYDPNWRPMLWSSEEAALREIKEGLAYCDILKVSNEELSLITGQSDIKAGIEALLFSGIKIVLVTMGRQGSVIANGSHLARSFAYDVKVVDTTGSGDSSFAACLSRILHKGKDVSEFTAEELADIADYANACGSVSASKAGGIPAMSFPEEIEKCMKEVPRLIVS